MNRYIAEEFYRNPALFRQRVHRQARQERGPMIVAAIRWLRDRLAHWPHLPGQLARLG